ncbi:MAG TPA: hypothetical protein VF529_00160 [Solirubrobacteraceae bacterium]|jgi:hypothetical protein
MPIPLQSGYEWEEDPKGNLVAHTGRTHRRDMRAKTDETQIAVVKRAAAGNPVERYSIGMERVAFRLGQFLGLPIPETYLEPVDGHPSSVQRRVEPARSWLQLDSAPAMKLDFVNEDMWPLGVLFDVWTGNTDRRRENFLFEPVPEGRTPGTAAGSRVWLIDHGQCGLWPGDKFAGNPADSILDDPTQISEVLIDAAEQRIAALMPPEYRMAFKNVQGEGRVALLDRVRSVGDDAIDEVMDEIPVEYMTKGQADATAAFLKARRDAIDNVIATYW